MKEISRQECWDDLLSQFNNDVSKTALGMLGILTGGVSDSWDADKIESFKKALIRKYSQESEA